MRASEPVSPERLLGGVPGQRQGLSVCARRLPCEAEVGERLRAWWGDAAYDGEEWWEFERFRDRER